jgi:hypothetical protein
MPNNTWPAGPVMRRDNGNSHTIEAYLSQKARST